MKRLLKFVLVAVLAIGSIASFVGCTETVYQIKYFIGTEEATGMPSSYTMSLDEPISLWLPAERENFIFDGWYASTNYSGVSVTTIPSRVKGDKTYYGQFIKSSSEIKYVIIDNNDVIADDDEETIDSYPFSSAAFTLWFPDAADYGMPDNTVFNGWYESEDLTGSQISQIAGKTTGDKVYYGKFEDASEYFDIAYYIDGVLSVKNGPTYGSPTPNKYRESENAVELWNPENEEKFTFDGWYENAACTGDKITEISATSSGNKTYYGKTSEPEGHGNGKVRKEYSVPDKNGNLVSISDFYGKKPIVIEFWQTQCTKCKASMPYYEKVYKDMKDTVEFMMICVGEPKEWADAYMKDTYTIPYYIDRNATIYGSYNFTGEGVPRAVFLDKWGYEVDFFAGQVFAETDITSRINKAIAATA